MAKRQVFFSFHYGKDNWRAGMVRNMGKVDDSSMFSDNDWETVKKKSDPEIKKWINDQMQMRSCLVVLIGAETSGRKWITYEIEKAYELQKGILGIYVHNLEDKNGNQTSKGNNPFYNIFTSKGQRLSNFVVAFDSSYFTSKNVYNDIKDHIEDLIEDAISVKGTH